MRAFIKKYNRILIALGANLFLVLLAVFVFGTRYDTDDDIAMARIAYGTFFEPQSRLVFSCTFLGVILKALFLLKDGINWQLIVYYLALFYGGTVSLYYIQKKNKNYLVLLWSLVVTAFYYTTYVSVNFSVISSMLALFGYVTLFNGTHSEEKLADILSVPVFVFSIIIRYESFFACSLFAFFAFALIYIKAINFEGMKKASLKYVVPFSIVLSIPICFVIVDRMSYAKEPWSDYVEYNDSRSQILDFQSVLQHEDQNYFDELGISEEMVKSLENWQFNDTEVFNEQLIIKLADDSKKYNPRITTDFIFEAIGYSVEKICKIYYFALGVLFLALITIKVDKIKRGGAKIFALPWIMIVPLFAEIGAYYFLNRGIDRVFRTTGLGFWCGLIVLLCCDYFDDDNQNDLFQKRWLKGATFAITLVGLICQMGDLKDVRGFEKVDKEVVREDLSFLNDGRIYMCDIKSVRVIEDAYGVWQTPLKNDLYNCIELGGWMVNYPSVRKKQDELGVSNPYKSLVYNDNAYLLTTGDADIQFNYLNSAYGSNIEKQMVEKHGLLTVYKFEKND